MLKAMSADAESVRWTEFARKYKPVMQGYLRARYPSLEPEDAMQETMIALMKALPNYHYTPDAKGHFRNYLIGILSHKAADLLAKRANESDKKDRFSRDSKSERNHSAKEFCARPLAEAETAAEEDFRQAALEAAIDQLLSDNRIQSTTREVFRHIALMHEEPEAVARAFGLKRNNVDQIKNRMIRRLADMVKAMTAG